MSGVGIFCLVMLAFMLLLQVPRPDLTPEEAEPNVEEARETRWSAGV